MDDARPLEGGTHATKRRLRRRRELIGAWITSILFHVGLFILCFATLKGAAVSGGAGMEAGVPDAIVVSLAGLRGGARASAPPSQAALNAIFQHIRDEQSPIQASPDKTSPRTSLDKLFDVIDQQRSAHDRSQANAAHGQGTSDLDRGGTGSAKDGSPSTDRDKLGKAGAAKSATGPGSASSTGNDLWGQIAPCWGRLPQVSTVPVTLEITLNAKGLIATPPKIVRPGSGAPDERRLISEARALAAVTACVPYHGDALAGNAGVFRVDFTGR
ncbi:MAG: hypothetical protein P4L64_15210 [Caulobacteraceae bacterium]|nr:hypothetical protein [Caulobacteraceae bacterium]